MFPSLKTTVLSGGSLENEEIKHIRDNMYTKEDKYEKETSRVSLYKSLTPRKEAAFAAAYIAGKLEKGAYADEFQVVCSNETEVKRVAKELESFGIPSYTEVKSSMASTPVYILISNVFDLLLI